MTKAARFGSLVVAMTVVCGLAVATAPAEIAKRGDLRVAGVCTGPSASKLKLSEEDGRIEVELRSTRTEMAFAGRSFSTRTASSLRA